jgi:surface protein
MSWMFESATSFNQEGLSKWDTSAVTTMKDIMFNGASIYVMEIYPLGTSLCSNTDMSDMFFGALYIQPEYTYVCGRITFLTAMIIISFLIQDAHFDAVRRSSREAHSVLLIARMIARGYRGV